MRASENIRVISSSVLVGHVRELPVFGVIEGVFVSGIIDELRYNTKGELELNELKTRSRPFMPGEAQRKKDHFQVSKICSRIST